ncbi:MAG: DNA polymerase, partial [Candidatus Heimdallarchaeaceae archaeon]
RQGYITSLSGFTFQGVLKKNEVVNYPIQALAFHCLLWGCIRLLKMIRKYRMKTKITFQIHDSLIGDVPKDEKRDYYDLLKQVMIHDLKDHWKFINIPLEIEVDSSKLNGNWYKMATELNYIG